jgi:uncharacterized protein (UPF0548 family)
LLLIRKPSEARVRRLLEAQKGRSFSYPEAGSSRHAPPPGYTLDHHRVRLGRGQEIFREAAAALRRWKMFDLGWLQLLWPNAPIEPGAVVAVLVRWPPFWFLNACRIVYVLEEQAPLRRFGFAYGTLPEHAERGEERFSVEWQPDDSVWYDILAFSCPNQWISRLGRRSVRRLQLRFALDSMAAMRRAAGGTDA